MSGAGVGGGGHAPVWQPSGNHKGIIQQEHMDPLCLGLELGGDTHLFGNHEAINHKAIIQQEHMDPLCLGDGNRGGALTCLATIRQS